MPVPEMAQASSPPTGPVYRANRAGSEKMPAPTMEPTTMATSASRESFAVSMLIPCSRAASDDLVRQTGSRIIGHVMQCPPPRPRPSSAPTMDTTSMPALRSSVLV
ncbi:hypothetical protein D3C71_1553410 [compost metagenome]